MPAQIGRDHEEAYGGPPNRNIDQTTSAGGCLLPQSVSARAVSAVSGSLLSSGLRHLLRQFSQPASQA